MMEATCTRQSIGGDVVKAVKTTPIKRFLAWFTKQTVLWSGLMIGIPVLLAALWVGLMI